MNKPVSTSLGKTHSTFEIRHSAFLPWLDFIVPILLAGFSCVMATRSSGFFELDELAHFMKARELWSDWRGVLDIWGRPLCTGLFALTAPLGLETSRLLAVAVTAMTAWGTVQLGKSFLGMLPAPAKNYRMLLWILLFGQPMFMLQSFAVMSEMLLACVWVWAMVALAHRKVFSASLLIGLGGLARPEGWAAIICWPVVLWLTTEGGRQKAEGRKQNAESRRQEAESRRQEAEGRRQEAGGRRQEAGDRRQAEESCQARFELAAWQAENGSPLENNGTLSGHSALPPDQPLAPSGFLRLPTASCFLPPVVCRLLPAVRLLPSAFCFLLSAFCLPPAAVCLLSVLAATTPTLAWWLAGWRAYGNAHWFVERWPWAARSPYGTTAGRFALSILIATALWITAAAFTGIRFLWKNRIRRRNYVERATLLVVAPLLGFVTLHGALGLFGLFGSLSLPRYYVAVSPFLAIMAWFGIQEWQQRFSDESGKSLSFWACLSIMAMMPTIALLLAGQLPIPRNAQFRKLDDAIQWVEDQKLVAGWSGVPSETAWTRRHFSLRAQSGQASPYVNSVREEVVAAHPYVYYRLGVPLDCSGHRRAFNRAALRDAPAGTVAIVENVIWQFDGFASAQNLAAWGYRQAWSSETKPAAARGWLNLLLGSHLLSLVGDAAQVEVWIKQQ